MTDETAAIIAFPHAEAGELAVFKALTEWAKRAPKDCSEADFMEMAALEAEAIAERLHRKPHPTAFNYAKTTANVARYRWRRRGWAHYDFSPIVQAWRGRRGGKASGKARANPRLKARVKRLRLKGMAVSAIAKEVGASKRWVYKVLDG